MKDELGWEVVYAYNKEILGENGTLGRKNYHEIVLWRYFNAALKRLNPWITDAQLAEARQILSSYLSSESLLQINEEKYFLIRDGIPRTRQQPLSGSQRAEDPRRHLPPPDGYRRFCERASAAVCGA